MGGIDVYPASEQSVASTTSVGGKCVVHPLTTLNSLHNKSSSASKSTLNFVIKKEANKTEEVLQSEATTSTKQLNLVAAHASKKPSKEQHQQVVFTPKAAESVATTDQTNIKQNETKAKKSARLAAKRAKEFEAKEIEKKVEEKQKASALLEQKKAVRRMNDEMHAKLGVKNVPIQQRIRQYQEDIKRKRLEESQSKNSKQPVRWYKQRQQAISSQYNAAENAAEFLRDKKIREKQEKEEIEAKQQQLSAKKQAIVDKAKQIVTKSTCEYIKGSYLLKKKKSPTNKKQAKQTEQILFHTVGNLQGENGIVTPPPAPVSSTSS